MSYLAAKILRTQFENVIHEREPSALFKSADFPWARSIEARHLAIKTEALEVLKRVDEITNFQDVLPSQRALTQGSLWKSYFLKAMGEDVEEHQRHCPATTEALKSVPGLINAFFSILRPGVHIPPHRGPYAGILRYHFGVIVPEGDVAIRVDGEVCRWKEGESLFFDDSFEHEAWNNTELPRVVLFVDLERPLPHWLSIVNRAILWTFKKSSAARSAQRHVLGHQTPFD